MGAGEFSSMFGSGEGEKGSCWLRSLSFPVSSFVFAASVWVHERGGKQLGEGIGRGGVVGFLSQPGRGKGEWRAQAKGRLFVLEVMRGSRWAGRKTIEEQSRGLR